MFTHECIAINALVNIFFLRKTGILIENLCKSQKKKITTHHLYILVDKIFKLIPINQKDGVLTPSVGECTSSFKFCPQKSVFLSFQCTLKWEKTLLSYHTIIKTNNNLHMVFLISTCTYSLRPVKSVHLASKFVHKRVYFYLSNAL